MLQEALRKQLECTGVNLHPRFSHLRGGVLQKAPCTSLAQLSVKVIRGRKSSCDLSLLHMEEGKRPSPAVLFVALAGNKMGVRNTLGLLTSPSRYGDQIRSWPGPREKGPVNEVLSSVICSPAACLCRFRFNNYPPAGFLPFSIYSRTFIF